MNQATLVSARRPVVAGVRGSVTVAMVPPPGRDASSKAAHQRNRLNRRVVRIEHCEIDPAD